RRLLQLHRQAYPTFWSWSGDVVDSALLTGELQTVFGFRRHVRGEPNVRSLRNFPMQANGAEMMRIAAISATEDSIEVGAPVHDAFLIGAPLDRLDEEVARMRHIMEEAGRHVLGGFTVRTDAAIVRFPDRYRDEAGALMWATVTRPSTS